MERDHPDEPLPVRADLQVLTGDDWRVWRALRLEALAEAPYAFGSTLADWQGDGDREERWRDRLTRPGAHNVVAFVQGRAVGMASGVPGEVPAEVELISMWVSPTVRGSGVADALVREIERWARSLGAASLCLDVVADNLAARSFYRRLGFADTGEPTASPTNVVELRMVKPLGS